MSIRKILSVVAIAALTLAACGKKDAATPAAQSLLPPAGPSTTGYSLMPASTPTASNLPSVVPGADPATPLGNYQKVDSGVQIAYLYYAVSGLPTDYERLADIASQDYRTTTDTFKKKDILDALKPQIDQQIAVFKNNPYVELHWESASLGHYDMTGQFFPVQNIPLGDGERAWLSDASEYRFAVTNGPQFTKFKVEDQAKAKELESIVTNGFPGSYVRGAFQTPADMYLFAQAVDQNAHIVKFQLVELNLNDPKGNAVGVIK